MKIKINKRDKKLYTADCSDLPGSPPIGIGKNKKEAVANLFVQLIWCDLIQKINMDEVVFIK